jgi:hypothetical protein
MEYERSLGLLGKRARLDNLLQTSLIDRFVTTGFIPDLPIHIARR